jgi:hypothetical protein
VFDTERGFADDNHDEVYEGGQKVELLGRQLILFEREA